MIVDLAYAAFAVAGLALFRWIQPTSAVAVVVLGGWVLLPVGHYPPGSAAAAFPYWITGSAVPSDMLLTKAWVAPAVAALGLLAFDRASVLALRPRWIDLPMAAWCLWPLAQAPFVIDPAPSPGLASLYLAGAWGLPWCLGRACFTTAPAQHFLVRGLVASALACLPFSLVEGVAGPVVYGWVFEPHPFRFDGSERYLGHRPVGFFEHGNQFGLWVSLCALAALWLARTEPAGGGKTRSGAAAVVVTAMAVAAQSAGGVLLLLLGALFLWTARRLRPRHLVAAGLVLLVLGGVGYLSGAVPIMKLGRDTAIGQHLVEGLRSVGRGSFAWRISQDQKLLADALGRPLSGLGHWDWWRAKDTRPWGLPVLVLGQFGLVGLGASFGSLLWPALRTAWWAPRRTGWEANGRPLMLATLVVLGVIDATMNSFIFFPGILIAGALAGSAPAAARPRGEITRLPRTGPRAPHGQASTSEGLRVAASLDGSS